MISRRGEAAIYIGSHGQSCGFAPSLKDWVYPKVGWLDPRIDQEATFSRYGYTLQEKGLALDDSTNPNVKLQSRF
jgi:hypothetical protein